ncbi:Major facilitator superfamily domain, general substrate transporter [Pseudocohnilembus persalinus]|uniref:Major facilitator superfamily domain, general substrate transporter n=1 Tax=Pseudocohnilembus persalinus TaxID=266149 RepID=A0A0V0QF39_PSEPJ|nr:Major facilitator superfamily domain, general substrate transporter [Pseudocohnilembus persalinus]|eukprot:KRX00760.1 Major facilitator superfamily domain, general substrate transporter [Pseudocohnilembus persalinus]
MFFTSYVNGFVMYMIFQGIFFGTSIGLIYMVPIRNSMKYFNKKGIVVGLSLLGYGLGAFFFNLIFHKLNNPQNLDQIYYDDLDVAQYYLALGEQYIQSAKWYYLATAMSSIGNGLGKFTWASLMDKIRFKYLNLINLFIQLILSVTIIRVLQQGEIFYIIYLGLSFFCFGGMMSMLPVLLPKIFGANVGIKVCSFFYISVFLSVYVGYNIVAFSSSYRKALEISSYILGVGLLIGFIGNYDILDINKLLQKNKQNGNIDAEKFMKFDDNVNFEQVQTQISQETNEQQDIKKHKQQEIEFIQFNSYDKDKENQNQEIKIENKKQFKSSISESKLYKQELYGQNFVDIDNIYV